MNYRETISRKPDPDLDWDEEDEQQAKLSERIANWARFTVDRGWRSSTCRSIEGRYKRERLSEEVEEEKRTPRLTQADIDAHMSDAWEIEDAWRQLPDVYRFALKFVYLKRWDPRKVWHKLSPYRSLQLRCRNYDEMLRTARFALRNQLRRRS